jgi:hypothetical protein
MVLHKNVGEAFTQFLNNAISNTTTVSSLRHKCPQLIVLPKH